MLWASGATFGVPADGAATSSGRRSGSGRWPSRSPPGSATLITTVPVLGTAMKVAGSAYLLYLAWQIARSGALQAATVSRPLGLVEAASFQLVNPKAWVFALGAITTFRPAGAADRDREPARGGRDDAGHRAHGRAVGGRRRGPERPAVRCPDAPLVSLALAAIVAATVVWVWI